jgi:hypothetical protein
MYRTKSGAIAVADIIDVANDQAEKIAVVERIARRKEGPAATGFCLWCGEPTVPYCRWCNVECRDDWQRHETRHGGGA